MTLVDSIVAAAGRIGPSIRETPLLLSPGISEVVGTRVFLKCENLQVTGSFKARGAVNKILGLTPAERSRGVVTASSGNHGVATAYAGQRAQLVPTVYLPENAAPMKVAKIKKLGATVVFFGKDSGLSEIEARRVADRTGQVYVSPYNDLDIVAGQGTIGLELAAQCPTLGAAIIAVGGGGLIGGIATYLDHAIPAALVIGSSPKNSSVMVESVRQGKIVDPPSLPTLSDGTAGGVEPGTLTLELCQRLVDDYDLPTEEEIAEAMRLVFESERLLVEGSAGVAVATAIRLKDRLRGLDVVIVLCGGNVSADTWCQVVRSGR